MKAMWSGNISFALISIQVKLYTASKSKDISFHLLHKKDNTPIEYQRWCPADKEVVPWSDIIRGYEYQKGRYVVVSEEELEKLPQRASKTISIENFIKTSEVEPAFYNKAYYLEPEEGSVKPYALLREAMRETGRVALAKITLREKEHLAVIRLYGQNLLMLNTLRYADEVVNPEALNIPAKTDLNKNELSLATELISRYTEKFNPAAYKDTYRETLMELIKAKIEGKEIKIPPPKAPAKVISLMDALRKSLETTGAAKEIKKPSEPVRTARTVKEKKRAKATAR
jgi:DNA end-binding protein Ku